MPNETIPTLTRDPKQASCLAPLRGSRYPLIDSHLHVVNFAQETPSGHKLIRGLDRANVKKAVIFGLPVAKLWAEYDREPPDYYLANDAQCYYYPLTDFLVADLYLSLPPEQQARLYPLLCGFNPTDRFAIRDVERIYDRFPDVWCGIGEILLRHDDLTAMTYGEPARANHRALDRIFEFAEEKDLPVLIHQNITSVWKSDHPVYLYELEEALRSFPRARFILAHCGMSRRVNLPLYNKMIERLLDRYPLLHVDYSWVIFDAAICPNGVPSPQWLALTEKYSERILLGSDLVAKFERLGPELQRYDAFLDKLSEQARENLCWRTAERLYESRKRACRRIPEVTDPQEPPGY